MVTLFDQEKVWEIHDYNIAKAAWQEGFEIGFKIGFKQGYEQGYEQGLEIGIQLVVSMLEDFPLSKEDIIRKLASHFDLPLHIAEEKARQYLTL